MAHSCAETAILGASTLLDGGIVWPYYILMATITIKSTYSLDVETVRQLEAMARRWKVSKSEALRRAIRAAANQQPAAGRQALRALDRLQDSLALPKDAAKRWERTVGNERRASARKLER